jgi:hypothetical protein
MDELGSSLAATSNRHLLSIQSLPLVTLGAITTPSGCGIGNGSVAQGEWPLSLFDSHAPSQRASGKEGVYREAEAQEGG